MNILVVCRVYPSHVIGGMPIAARMHAQALARLGHNVTFATTLHSSGKAFMEMDGDVEVHYLPLTHSGVADADFGCALLRFFDEAGGFDCVLSESTGAHSLIGKAPTTAFLHGYQMEGVFNSLAQYEDTGDESLLEEAKRYLISGFEQRHELSQYAAVAALSGNCYRDLTQKLFLTNVYSANNGIDTELFTPCKDGVDELRKSLDIPDGNRIVLTACHLIQIKGVHHLLQAMPNILENVSVVICGTGPQLPELRELTEPFGSRVIFAGEIANEEMPKYYNMADLFFSGSYHYSGLDMNVLEALACNCPVVGCRTPGKMEVIDTDTDLTYSLSQRNNLHEIINGFVDDMSLHYAKVRAKEFGDNVRRDHSLEVSGRRLALILRRSMK